mmetsp:Transcript_18074/g.26045  ORF Transcript_18074/g.26045 Transcript_18074/m.26045 type:complete len:130 (-) Transcript_18074:3094-3483(-)
MFHYFRPYPNDCDWYRELCLLVLHLPHHRLSPPQCLSLIVIPFCDCNHLFYAFYSCSSLTSISIPTSVNIISDAAFYSCTSLSSISIPTSVTYIGSYAFAGCTSLTCRRIAGSPVVDSSAFYGDPANTC